MDELRIQPFPLRPPPTTPEGILLEPGDRSNEDATQRALDGPGFTRVRQVPVDGCPDEDCEVPGCEDWGACSDCGWSGHGHHACQGWPE